MHLIFVCLIPKAGNGPPPTISMYMKQERPIPTQSGWETVPAPFLSSTREGGDMNRTPRSRSQLDSVWTTTFHGTLAMIIV